MDVRETSDGHRWLNDAADSATLLVYRKNDTRDGEKEWGEGFTRVNINVCEQPRKYEKADSATVAEIQRDQTARIPHNFFPRKKDFLIPLHRFIFFRDATLFNHRYYRGTRNALSSLILLLLESVISAFHLSHSRHVTILICDKRIFPGSFNLKYFRIHRSCLEAVYLQSTRLFSDVFKSENR